MDFVFVKAAWTAVFFFFTVTLRPFCLLNPVDNPTKRSFQVKSTVPFLLQDFSVISKFVYLHAPGFMDGMKGNLRILDLACGRGQDILKHPA